MFGIEPALRKRERFFELVVCALELIFFSIFFRFSQLIYTCKNFR